MRLILSTLLVLCGCATKPLAPLPTIIPVGPHLDSVKASPPLPPLLAPRPNAAVVKESLIVPVRATFAQTAEQSPIKISAKPWPRIQFEGVPSGNWTIWKSDDLTIWRPVASIEQWTPGRLILFDIAGDPLAYYKMIPEK